MATEVEMKHIHDDIEQLKTDISVIKHILSEEGKLSDEAKNRLEKSRKTPINKYIKL